MTRSQTLRPSLWSLLILLLSLVLVPAQTPAIRLRNELIPTPAKNSAPKKNPSDALQNGLFLIQLEGPLQPAWTAELERRGATLVRYIPDQAFIARGRQVRLADLDELPFVRWTGPFRPEHKIWAPLKGKSSGQELSVSILFAPDVTPLQLAAVRPLMKSVAANSRTRIGPVWRGVVSRLQLDALAASDAVLWIERAPDIKLMDEVASKIVGGDSGTHATTVQSLGYDGSGVVVSVADSGLHLGSVDDMHPDLLGRVDALFYYGQLTDAMDEHGHGTHCAGIVAGNGATGELDDYGMLWGLGVAPGAHLIAQRLFDGEGNYEAPPSFSALTHDAVAAGADIGSNSWGDDTQGRYDLSAAEFDALVRDSDGLGTPYILEFSAGNAGPGTQTIGSPAVAKNVIATGASQNDRFDYFIYADGRETMADFSSRGPAEDGRIKPDVVAPGTWISSLRSPAGNDEFAWADISAYYMFQGGTSQAGPHASGAAAVFVQYYREQHTNATPSPALVKAALINSAVDMFDEFETAPAPNMDEGWGRIDLTELIGSERTYDFVDQSARLATGEQYERRVVISDSGEPLKVTLAYTDVPGFPGATVALVNDLDLEVVAPDGAVYRGNQFDGVESVPNAASADAINNVEGVYIGVPLPGEYVVRVRARQVAQDARLDSLAIDQDFALVTSGLVLPPGQGIVFLDRPAYTAPSQVRIKVIDASLGNQPTVSVTVRSAREPAGFNVSLSRAGTTGSYTGSVQTLTGQVVNDTSLQLAHGDWIRVEYFDQSDAAWREAQAVADLLPPQIAAVGLENEFGQAVIVWNTDEPSGSVVRFGSDATLPFAITNATLVTTHRVKLSNLIPGQTYFLTVSSTDAAGNTTLDDNGGALHQIVAPTNATVLLVDAYHDSPEGGEVPLSAYTGALDAAGVSYDVLEVTTAASSPSFALLQPYAVVIWRINDAYDSSDTLSTSQQNIIRQYVTNGGSFFMSSMELISRIIDNGGSGFVTNVLHVSRFTRNNFFNPCPTCDEDHTVPTIAGEDHDPVGDGLLADLDYAGYPAIDILGLGPDFADTFGVSRDAAPIFYDTFSGEPAGMRYPRTGQESTGRVVFLSFPLDAVPESGPQGNVRAELVRRVMQFLIPGLNGIGTVAFDREQYTLPDRVTIEVADSDLAGQGQLTVQGRSDSVSTPVPILLLETVRRGIFRGSVALTNTLATPAPNLLRAESGERIFVDYLDASGGFTVSDEAVIDTIPPVVFNISVAPDYESATVFLETSEAADVTVQFGESALLGRTAFNEELATSHELTLNGLRPDTAYQFRIIIRDAAGNVLMDDSFGTNYAFRTLQPISPPVADNFDAGAPGWTVFDSDDTQTSWILGVPNNGAENNAHSPPYAWGSVLNGGRLDTVDTFLISPAILLSGGNSITLSFWHSYDFSVTSEFDLINGGELLLITNVNVTPITLATYFDLNGGWDREQIDLSPYLGHVVYLVWHHQLFSFDTSERPGWLVDDVSITSASATPGTLRIKNNLTQAGFVLSGPLSLTAQGLSLEMTNAPPGDYTVTWLAVTNYLTPPPATSTVVPQGLTTISGTYAITDSNANGLADSWEQQYFGAVTPGRNPHADTDGDGLTDLAEFLAGTNPTNRLSNIRFLNPVVQNTGGIRFDWSTVPGRGYRIGGSADLITWQPVTDWIRANGNFYSFTTNSVAGVRFYRLEVRP